METKRTLPTKLTRWISYGLVLFAGILIFAGCGNSGRPSDEEMSGSPSKIEIPTQTLVIDPAVEPTEAPWPVFEVSKDIQPTEVPPQTARVILPEGTSVWLLLGAEGELPSRGRTQAIHLLLVNERLSKASVISIPGTTFLYLPGQGMGRINTAYPLGGIQLVYDTLIYNFGLRPNRYVVAHETEFAWLVDDLGGLEVSVLISIRHDCGGLPAGLHSMDGSKTLCYVSYQSDDEINRTRRQQQVLRLLFTKLVQRGRLVKLPLLYESYDQNVDTDVAFMELFTRIPLALRLGDPDRVKYFVLGWEELELWELPGLTRTIVLLPRPGKIEQLVNQAVDAIREPSALNEVVLTYEAQLTEVVGLTHTAEAGLTRVAIPTSTPTPWVTQGPTATSVTPTATAQPTAGTPLPSSTHTPTGQPSQTPLPSPTSGEPYPVPTIVFDTPTQQPYP